MSRKEPTNRCAFCNRFKKWDDLIHHFEDTECWADSPNESYYFVCMECTAKDHIENITIRLSVTKNIQFTQEEIELMCKKAYDRLVTKRIMNRIRY